MARNKKNKKKQAQEESSEEEHSDVEETHEEGAETKAEGSDAESDAKSDASSEKPKKKEYRGKKGNLDGKGKKGKEDKGAAAKGEADKEEEIIVTRQPAVSVLYCPICTFPAEMCEFSGMMEKCRPWLQEHAAELAEAEEKGRRRRILTEKDRLEAMLEGRGVKKALERVVLLTAAVRTGKRMTTSIYGMDLFGFNLKDISKEWRKTFSSGGGVRAAAEGETQDCVDIQGNVVDQLAELLVSKYNIPKEAIYVKENKQKRKYFQ
ncbi:Translation initiation factor SUI1, putative [Angomonas deanei]|uniref:Translation initiation factor SUI1, putative n=1 Tax=Angomonas deanei TaxID=59799 RepID=A0A7G2CDY4_9TRYP|nr:Translation initiation factor SUI1, putative [Angomonas deanei]